MCSQGVARPLKAGANSVALRRDCDSTKERMPERFMRNK